MTKTLDFMVSWPIEFIWAITLAALGILALLGWMGHAVYGLGKLRKAIKDARLEIAQLWKKDPLENLKQFRELTHNGKAGCLSQALEQSILLDTAGRPAAISEPQLSLEPVRLIRTAVGRFGSIPALHLMILVGILGTLMSALTQLQIDRSQMTLAIAMPGLLSLLMIILYQVVDHLAVYQATRAIEQFQDVLRQHFPVITERQLQFQTLAAQKQTASQLKAIAPELTIAISDSIQKQLAPTIRNMSQSFDQAIKHVNDQQQQGMGRLASHFTRQLQQLLGQNLDGLSASVEKLQTLHEASCTHLESLMTVLDRSAGLQSESQAAAQALLTNLAESRQSLAESAAKLDTIHESSAAHLSQIFTDSSALISQSLTAATENLDQTYRSGADRMSQTFTDGSSLFGQSLAASAAQLVESLSSSSGQLNQIFSDGGNQLSQILADGGASLGQTYATASDTLQSSYQTGADTLSQTFTDGSTQLSQTFAEGSSQLNQTLTEGSNQLSQSMSASSANLAESLTGTASQIQQVFADGGSQLTRIMDDGAGQLGQAYTASTDQLNQAYAAASDNLNLSYKSSATQLDNALAASGLAFSQTLASHVDQLNQSLGLSTERLVDSTGHLNTSSDLLNQSLTSLVQELNRVLETSTSQLNEAFTTATNDLNQKYNSGSDEISRTFNTGTEQLNQALTSGAEHLTQIYAASKVDLNQAIVAGTEQLTQSMLTSSEQMTQSLVASSDLLSRNLAANSERFNDSLLSGSDQLGFALTRTSELAVSLQTLLAESQESSTRFREDQLQVEQQIGSYFDQMHQQIIRVQDDLQANLVDIFAKFTDLTTTTLVQSDEQYQQMMTKLTEESTQLMNTLDDQVRELSFLVRDVATEISGLNKTLDNSLQQFGDQMQGSTRATFESFDEGLSGIVGQLTDTIRLISDAVDDLPAAVVSARELLTAQSQAGSQSDRS